MERLHTLVGVLGLVDVSLAVLLAGRVSRGEGMVRFIAVLRNPPVPPLLRGYGDFVETLFYCWLLVFGAPLVYQGEEVLDALSLGVTLTLLVTSIVYLTALLLSLSPRQR